MTSPMLAHPALPRDPEAVLVRTPNWLGDLVMSTAFLQALLNRFPQARVDLIVRKGFEALPLPHRGKVIPFDRKLQGLTRFGWGLRRGGYTHAFVLPPSFSAAWMLRWSGAPQRVGLQGEGRGWLLNPALPRTHAARSVHLTQEYLDLLRPWGEHPSLAQGPYLPATPAWVAEHLPAALHSSAPYAVLAPGAEYGPAKQWPLRHYAQVAAGLHARGLRVVAAGLPADRPAGDAIVAAAPGGLNLCGSTSLLELTALLARCAVVVSNDSGAMHLAAALERPQVAVFGSTNPIWTGPVNARARVLTRQEPCAPCYGRTCHLGHTRCLEALEPGLALQAVEDLLREPPAAP